MREYTAEELLDAREKRVDFQSELLKHYRVPLIVGRVNYPGLRKTNALTLKIIEDISSLMDKSLGRKVLTKQIRHGAEGPIFYFAVQDDAMVLKNLAINFEEVHPLGRCLDLDVFDRTGRGISRQELGYPKRTCYLCENEAQACVRSKRHSQHEVIAFIEEKFQKYKETIYDKGE